MTSGSSATSAKPAPSSCRSSAPAAALTSTDRGRSLRRLALAVAALLALALAGALPARAQTELVPGYPESPVQGGATAKGAVIWNHGLDRVAEAEPIVPFVIDYLRDAGFDVFVLKRRWAGEGLRQSSEALAAAVAALKTQGYRKVVLAGQSFGAWISFVVGASRDDVDAILALAPAAYGPAKPEGERQPNAEQLYPLVEKLKVGRAMVFLFDRDTLDPGDRGPAIAQILDRRGVPHAIIDRPEGLVGHGVGITSGFAHRFGPCVVAFIVAEPPAPDFSCDRVPPSGQIAFVLPKGIRIVPPPANAAPGLAAFSGRWYGHLNNGREVLLVVEEMGVDRVLAIYAWARSTRATKDRSGYTRRRGEYDPATGTLSFTEPGQQALRFHLRPDGRMDASWIAKDDSYTLTGILGRISER